MTGRWGPDWLDVAGPLAQLGWADARPTREVRDGGYSPASRWIVERSDGARAFVKAVAPRPERPDARGIVAEWATLSVGPAPMLPRAYARHDGGGQEPFVVVMEDLSAASWGIPATERDASLLRDALDALQAVTPPPTLERVPANGLYAGVGWAAIARDPAPVIASGLLRQGWIDQHVGELVDATATLDHVGTSLVHGDLWLQNWCRTDRGAVLVDWTGAAIGNPRINHAWGEAGVRAAGGPAGIVLERADDDHAAWAAYMCGLAVGFYAEDAGNPAAPPRLLATQAREALAMLAWACDVLELASPPVPAQLASLGPWQP